MEITAGFIPLVDAAMLIAAKERGFAAEEGLQLNLVRETSWANIRDRIAIGHFEAAHMVAPMAIAGWLGMSALPVPVVAPFALGPGRNGITVATAIAERMGEPTGAAESGAAFAAAVAQLPGGRKPVFSVVHTYSAHAYLLRYWLAAAGIDPDRDAVIEIVPPPFLPDALASGRIDGFCVGEPWNAVAETGGAGRMVTRSDAIWPGSPDKILGFRADWAEANGDAVARLVRAVYKAGLWCDRPENAEALAMLLARPEYLNTRADLVLPGVQNGPVGFVSGHGGFPWMSDALWFFAQMVRWGQIELSDEAVAKVQASYRPDLYRAALSGLDPDIPDTDTRPAALFDGRPFDAGDLEAYLAAFG